MAAGQTTVFPRIPHGTLLYCAMRRQTGDSRLKRSIFLSYTILIINSLTLAIVFYIRVAPFENRSVTGTGVPGSRSLRAHGGASNRDTDSLRLVCDLLTSNVSKQEVHLFTNLYSSFIWPSIRPVFIHGVGSVLERECKEVVVNLPASALMNLSVISVWAIYRAIVGQRN
ncbi:hypothetical protein CBL_12496 [Carabus blaptoides fortunei]